MSVAEIPPKHMEGGEMERCACSQDEGKISGVQGTGKAASKFPLCGELPVRRLDRQVTGVNRTRIWAHTLDRLGLQMAKRRRKGTMNKNSFIRFEHLQSFL